MFFLNTVIRKNNRKGISRELHSTLELGIIFFISVWLPFFENTRNTGIRVKLYFAKRIAKKDGYFQCRAWDHYSKKLLRAVPKIENRAFTYILDISYISRVIFFKIWFNNNPLYIKVAAQNLWFLENNQLSLLFRGRWEMGWKG